MTEEVKIFVTFSILAAFEIAQAMILEKRIGIIEDIKLTKFNDC